jgi:hypothetical protein
MFGKYRRGVAACAYYNSIVNNFKYCKDEKGIPEIIYNGC